MKWRIPLQGIERMQTITSGTIGKDQLLTLLQNLYPREDPKTIHELATLYLSEVDKSNQAVDFKDRSGLDDKQLLRVAVEMSLKHRDWKLLANNLGLLEKDCSCLERKRLDVKSQILATLQIWLKTCREAPLPLLQAALRHSGNTDICNVVFSLNF
ncbi:unnamed protein product [Caretta caretta]